MQKVSLKVVLKLKAANDKEGYLAIRAGLNSKYRFKTLKYKIPAAQWNDEDEIVKKSYTDAAHINAMIEAELDKIKDEIEALQKKHDIITLDQVGTVLNRDDSYDFIAFFKEYLDYMNTERKGGKKFSSAYIIHWETQYNRLTGFAGETLAFEEIDARWLEKYEQHLSKRLNNSTLFMAMKRLRQMIKRAIEREHMKLGQIRGYKFPTPVKSSPRYLTLAETDKIMHALQSGRYDHKPSMKTVAAFFLIECYAGIRFSDWHRFEVEKLVTKDNFKVHTTKNKEPIYLPLNKFPRLKAVIEYIGEQELVFTLTEPPTNRILKLIALDLDIKTDFRFSTHTGRHTCGTMLAEIGWSTEAIAEVLGITRRTAEVYTTITRQKVMNEAERWGGL
jgi:integrase